VLEHLQIILSVLCIRHDVRPANANPRSQEALEGKSPEQMSILLLACAS
jgi:hypothetical protein